MRKLIVFIGIIFLTGCATISDRQQGSIKPPPGYGYAIFSLTGKAFEPDSAAASINWRSLDTLQSGTAWASMNTDIIFGGPQAGMTEGKLQLLTLPPGKYMLTDAYDRWREESAWATYPKMQTYPLNLSFTINEGEAIYLGEIQLGMDYRPSASLLDSRVRDFNHMQNVWKVRDMSPVVVRLLK